MSPSKRAFEKYKPRGLFSEFSGILQVPRSVVIWRFHCNVKIPPSRGEGDIPLFGLDGYVPLNRVYNLTI